MTNEEWKMTNGKSFSKIVAKAPTWLKLANALVSYFQFFSLRFSAYLRDLCVETAVNAENAEVRREPQRNTP